MNAVASSYLNQSALRYLKRNPNFFKMSLKEKDRIIGQIVEDTKKKVGERMKVGTLPKTLDMVRVLSNRDSDKIKNVVDWLGLEGDIDDIIGTEDALGTLNKIKFYYDKYDRLFFGDLDIGKKD